MHPAQQCNTLYDVYTGTWMFFLSVYVDLVNMPDPIQKHFGYGQLWSLWPVCSQNPDPTSCIWFGSILPKKVRIILCKTGPGLVWMAWPGFGQMHLVQEQASVQKSSGQVLAKCNQPTTCFPLSDLVAFFHIWPWSHCAKSAWIRFGSGQTDLVQCLGPTLLSQSRSDVNQIQHVCWGMVYVLYKWT